MSNNFEYLGKQYQDRYGLQRKCCICKRYIKRGKPYYLITSDGKLVACKRCVKKNKIEHHE